MFFECFLLPLMLKVLLRGSRTFRKGRLQRGPQVIAGPTSRRSCLCYMVHDISSRAPYMFHYQWLLCYLTLEWAPPQNCEHKTGLFVLSLNWYFLLMYIIRLYPKRGFYTGVCRCLWFHVDACVPVVHMYACGD